ncbi:MAG: ABC transporter permease [bacterium]|nr:ABC transporter permease [bacterium]
MDRTITYQNNRFPFLDPWIWKMAWRDSRTYRGRLLLFLSCILLGVASLVAVRSLGDNLEAAVQEQAKTLLGADLVIRSRRAFDPDVQTLIDDLSDIQSREIRFASMVYFPKNNSTRLIQVRALKGDFPYYGDMVTDPPKAAVQYQANGEALLDNSLMLQFDAKVGDSVRLGTQTFRIAGRVKKIPGEALAVMTIAPRVFIPLSTLETTGLIQIGSLASYYAYFKFEDQVDLSRAIDQIRPYQGPNRVRFETVARRQRSMDRTLGNLYKFLNLVAFTALLLGCIGVSSAVHVYIRQKFSTVAILRCLGVRSGQAFTIYTLQTLAMGILGSILGALLGLLIQHLLPLVLAQLLPVELSTSISYQAISEGIIIGLSLTLLFALLPLLPIRRISPLRTLRASFENDAKVIDEYQVGVVVIIVLLVSALAVFQSGNLILGLGITAGFIVAFLFLAGTARLIMTTVKRNFPTSWQYVWRQGLANLYRPNNQTSTLMLALGLGTFLIATLYLSQHSLLHQVSLAGSSDRPNMVMFDIQSDQVDGVADLIQSYNLPIIHRVPVVTMRLASVQNLDLDTYHQINNASRWALYREYRTTYRADMHDSERLIAGEWTHQTWDGSEPVPISLEEGVARSLSVTLGDTLTFDVQGIPMTTTIRSLRSVDWQRVQPNFFVVFPPGVLEPAPQFHVFTTHFTSPTQSANLQRALVQKYPNVSVVDLGLILQTVDDVLSQVAFVIRFMALFSIITGLIVLASAVITSRYQRIQEGVLLRTLGASRKQITQILVLEYLFLGALAAFTGLLLSIGGGWALSTFVFDIAFAVPSLELAAVFFFVTLLTAFIGMLNSRGIANRPPLEILRTEG